MLQDAFDPAAFRALGHELVDLLANHLDRTQKGEGKVLDWVEPQQMLDATPTLGGARCMQCREVAE